ncbi:hypothetical protein QTP88_017374 [Uroleucon formosanum]
MKVFGQKMLYGATVVKWMQGHGGTESALIQNSTVASAILSLPASLAATERSFSVYYHIHNKKRNRLTNTNASKLLFIQANMNNIDFLSPDKISKLETDRYLENVDEILNEDDSEEEDTEENYDTEDLVESDNLSDEHYVLSDDEFYESHFK